MGEKPSKHEDKIQRKITEKKRNFYKHSITHIHELKQNIREDHRVYGEKDNSWMFQRF